MMRQNHFNISLFKVEINNYWERVFAYLTVKQNWWNVGIIKSNSEHETQSKNPTEVKFCSFISWRSAIIVSIKAKIHSKVFDDFPIKICFTIITNSSCLRKT